MLGLVIMGTVAISAMVAMFIDCLTTSKGKIQYDYDSDSRSIHIPNTNHTYNSGNRDWARVKTRV